MKAVYLLIVFLFVAALLPLAAGLPLQAAPAAQGPDASVENVLAAASQVAVGSYHVCALTRAGGVKCWGQNWSGQLGIGATGAPHHVPVDVAGLSSGVTAITAGSEHTCALMSGGSIKCWGDNGGGQLGDGTTNRRLVPTDVTRLTSGVVAISAGSYHTCALTAAGAMKCWGQNWSGQLGDNTNYSRNNPGAVAGLSSGVVGISAGDGHTCALMASGAVKCWGNNNEGQVGDATQQTRLAPVDVSGLSSGATAVSAGGAHTCAVMDAAHGGNVKCWGYNASGQLGRSSTQSRLTPVDVNAIAGGASAVDAGYAHTCAIVDGGAKCWGNNPYGQVGDGTIANRYTAAAADGLSEGVAGVEAGNDASCALLDEAHGAGIRCWGAIGMLGDGYQRVDRYTPVPLPAPTGGAAISAGGWHTCALVDGGALCWGRGERGQLGDGTNETRYGARPVSGLSGDIAAISAGGEHACALTAAGGVKCWGYNASGQIGDGTKTYRYAPVDVSGLASGVAAVVAGGYHTCALTTGGALQCWGDNSYGQVGDGSNTNRLAPVPVTGLSSGVIAVAAGYVHTCALMDAARGGGVKCWGWNFERQLGDGTYQDRSAPVDVKWLPAGARSLAAGEDESCALMDKGGGDLGVTCWGHNQTPHEMQSLSSGVRSLTGGQDHGCAVLDGGDMMCWGRNDYGQLGNGTASDSYIYPPVSVVGLPGPVVRAAGGGNHTCALLASGGLACWGQNGYGQLGVNPGWSPVSVIGFGDPPPATATPTATPSPTPTATATSRVGDVWLPVVYGS